MLPWLTKNVQMLSQNFDVFRTKEGDHQALFQIKDRSKQIGMIV